MYTLPLSLEALQMKINNIVAIIKTKPFVLELAAANGMHHCFTITI